MKPLLGYLGTGLLFGGVLASILLFTPIGKLPLQGVFLVGDVTPVDFATLTLPDRPNQYLLCPPGYCNAVPHAESPVFDIPVDRLEALWRQVVAGEPRVEVVAVEPGEQVTWVQRSARFRFPDIVTVRFIPLSPTRSTLAIYSRSVYGRADFGVNRARVEDWLGKLRQSL